jgi:hypothetical protein
MEGYRKATHGLLRGTFALSLQFISSLAGFVKGVADIENNTAKELNRVRCHSSAI